MGIGIDLRDFRSALESADFRGPSGRRVVLTDKGRLVAHAVAFFARQGTLRPTVRQIAEQAPCGYGTAYLWLGHLERAGLLRVSHRATWRTPVRFAPLRLRLQTPATVEPSPWLRAAARVFVWLRAAWMAPDAAAKLVRAGAVGLKELGRWITERMGRQPRSGDSGRGSQLTLRGFPVLSPSQPRSESGVTEISRRESLEGVRGNLSARPVETVDNRPVATVSGGAGLRPADSRSGKPPRLAHSPHRHAVQMIVDPRAMTCVCGLNFGDDARALVQHVREAR